MKSLYANRLGYTFLYLITFIWAAISSQYRTDDIIFLITLIIFLIFFYYISHKRVWILSFSKGIKKMLFVWLLSPILWILLFWLFSLIIIYFNIMSIETLLLNNYIIFFPLALWFINIISFITITIWKIDKNNPISKEKDTLIKNKLFWPIYFSKRIKDNFLKNDSKKWWYENIFYIFIIFIPITILLSQINNELFYKKYVSITAINNEKVNIQDIKAPEELIKIIKLDLDIFNEINANSSNDRSWINRLNRFYEPPVKLKNDYDNFVKVQKSTLLLNNNNIYIDDDYSWRNYNFFGKGSFIWDIYLITDDIEYIYNCSREKECFLNLEKIKEKVFIDDDWIFIILFYLIVWFIFIKIFPNIFRILYYMFLPFSVLFLLIKKYFWKLEEIEKKLKK